MTSKLPVCSLGPSMKHPWIVSQQLSKSSNNDVHSHGSLGTARKRSDARRFSTIGIELNSQAVFEDRRLEMDEIEGLLRASKKGELATVRKMCEDGVSPDVQGYMGWTAAHWAARNGHIEILAFLREFGANLDIVDGKGDTLLHKAAANNQFATIEWLICNHFNIQASNNNGIKPIQLSEENIRLARSRRHSKEAIKCSILLDAEDRVTF